VRRHLLGGRRFDQLTNNYCEKGLRTYCSQLSCSMADFWPTCPANLKILGEARRRPHAPIGTSLGDFQAVVVIKGGRGQKAASYHRGGKLSAKVENKTANTCTRQMLDRILRKYSANSVPLLLLKFLQKPTLSPGN